MLLDRKVDHEEDGGSAYRKLLAASGQDNWRNIELQGMNDVFIPKFWCPTKLYK